MKPPLKRFNNLLDLSVVITFILIATGVILNYPGLGFASVNNPPYIPRNPAPANHTTNVSVVGTSLDWDGGDPDPQDNVTYDVFFGRNTPPPLLTANITDSNYTLGELNFTTNYYWQIKAWDSYNNTTQGPLWDFQTEINNPPNMPNTPNPIDGATGVPILNTILSWLGGDPDPGDTVLYDLYFGNHTSPDLLAGNLTAANYTLGELNYTTNYYWEVKAHDNHDNYANGTEWDFATEINQTEINNPPNMPNTPNPIDGATGVPILNTILSWLGGDPDPGDTVRYDLYFGNYTSPGLLAGNLTETSYALNQLNYNNTYYWEIKATDNHGNYTEGQEWDFVSAAYVPYNHPPYAMSQGIGTWIDTPLNITLQAADQDGDTLDFLIVDNPRYGILSGAAPEVIYTPNTGFAGSDSFTFKAFDGQDYSNLATVHVGVYENFAWSTAQRVDVADGTQPTLAYAPNGDLRVFYNTGTTNPYVNHLAVRKRLNGDSVFGPEVFVYDDARTAAIHYDTINANTIDLAVGTALETAVLQSQDGGNTWNLITSYDSWNGWSTPDAYVTSGFTEDSPEHLRIFYTNVIEDDNLFKIPHLRYAQRIDGNWNEESIVWYETEISGTYERGDNVCIFNRRENMSGRLSTDNGITFDVMNMVEQADMDVDDQGRLYAIRTTLIYPEPFTYLLCFEYSDDAGITWHNPPLYYIFYGSSAKFLSPRFAVNGDVMVITWVHEDIPDTPKFIKCVISKDKGMTWSPVQTIVTAGSSQEIGVSRTAAVTTDGSPLDIENRDGKFSLAYSVTDHSAWGRYGVFLKEIDVQEWNHPPILAPIGNKGVYAGYLLQFNVSATDDDPDDDLTLTATPLPSGANFVDHGDGTGTFTWTPAANQLGNYPVRFEVSDGRAADYEDIVINVSQYTGGPPCFLSHTPILMANGSSKPIEKVKVGDVILAYDVDNGKTVKDTVKEVFVHDADSYLVINNKLKVTANHPVFSNGKWVEIGLLKVGDKLLNHKGKYQKIKSIRKVKAKEKVYNFHVSSYHTYIANGYVAHNRKLLYSVHNQGLGD